MTAMTEQRDIADLSDAELIEAANTARDDLAKAAADEPEGEWHQACFAGVLVYAGELQKRGLKLATFH